MIALILLKKRDGIIKIKINKIKIINKIIPKIKDNGSKKI
jgi:hypothetical protein